MNTKTPDEANSQEPLFLSLERHWKNQSVHQKLLLAWMTKSWMAEYCTTKKRRQFLT